MAKYIAGPAIVVCFLVAGPVFSLLEALAMWNLMPGVLLFCICLQLVRGGTLGLRCWLEHHAVFNYSEVMGPGRQV